MKSLGASANTKSSIAQYLGSASLIQACAIAPSNRLTLSIRGRVGNVGCWLLVVGCCGCANF